jgi:hypothetical protein
VITDIADFLNENLGTTEPEFLRVCNVTDLPVIAFISASIAPLYSLKTLDIPAGCLIGPNVGFVLMREKIEQQKSWFWDTINDLYSQP